MASVNTPGVFRKKKIGLVFPSRKGGGVFQYALSIADSLIGYADKFDYAIIHYEGEKPELFFDKKAAPPEYISVPSSEHLGLITKALHFLSIATKNNIFTVKKLHDVLKGKAIDLLVIPTPLSFDLPLDMPFVASVPDYMHKHDPSQNNLKTRLTRDIIYTYFAKRAARLVADDEQTAEDLVRFAKVSPNKIEVIPYIPPSYIYKYKDMGEAEAASILKKFNLPDRYIFFPAQFWENKNHVRLVEALNKIKIEKGITIPLVLVGSNKGNHATGFEKMVARLKELNMERNVLHLGYAEDKEIVALYKKSAALVAPSLQGPTTIPPLEAMLIGTAVVTVNKYKLPAEVGDAGLLFDPYDVADMAEKIYEIWTDENLRLKLIAKGTTKAKNELGLDVYAKKWEKVIDRALTDPYSK